MKRVGSVRLFNITALWRFSRHNYPLCYLALIIAQRGERPIKTVQALTRFSSVSWLGKGRGFIGRGAVCRGFR